MRPGVKIALWLHDGHTSIGIRGYCMHIVAPGNSFITARGNIKPGEEIKESDFANRETFIRHVSQKRIVAGKSNAQQAKDASDKAAATAKTDKENADKRKQDTKAKATGQLEAAQMALKNAQEAQVAAKDTANKIANDLCTIHKAQIEKLDKKIVDCEKVVKNSETATEKANPEHKEEAEKNLLATMESLEMAKKERVELTTAIENTPELLAALRALEKANDALIEAEANVAEAKRAVAKAE